MKTYQMADSIRTSRMNTSELRETFLVDGLAIAGHLNLAYVDLDRAVLGFVIPTDRAIHLPSPTELRAEYFCERRELGILNVGGPGTVTVDGKEYPLGRLDGLYVGRGAKNVIFASTIESEPSSFYLLSYPAHASYPTTIIPFADINPVELGTAEGCNRRKIYKLIHLEGIRSCQLVMGFTLLESGSCWNTMPAHTHMRRSEIYMYFDIPSDQCVVHLMGQRDATKHLILQNKQVAISPGWSVHAGVGTSSYGFCWGMGGENQQYSDMDAVAISEMK